MSNIEKHKLTEARLYKTDEYNVVICQLCGHRCRIKPDKLGICNVRQNIDGKLYTLVYGQSIAQQTDPIEKKPLFHFYPGTKSYSIATVGCNYRCSWCQNWHIAHLPKDQPLPTNIDVSPAEIVSSAKHSNCRSIAYTYTEPTIFFEYAYDTARLAHEAGLANIYVTNGFMTAEMLDAFHPYLDAANVDLKSFDDKIYKKYCGARLQPVLDNLKHMNKLGIWLEITTLVIPDLNDDPEELRDIASFIANELGKDTPWHISRFFPQHKMTDRPPTPIQTLENAMEIGQSVGLNYIYVGNVRGGNGENTRCPDCGKTLINRSGYTIIKNHIQNGKCPDCHYIIAGVGL